MPQTIVTMLLLLAFSPISFATAGESAKDTAFLQQLVADATPANTPEKIKELAGRIDRKEVTIEQFADFYFANRKGIGESRKRWVRNMTANFRIINHRTKKHNPQKEILAKRAVTLTLLQLRETMERAPSPAPVPPR